LRYGNLLARILCASAIVALQPEADHNRFDGFLFACKLPPSAFRLSMQKTLNLRRSAATQANMRFPATA